MNAQGSLQSKWNGKQWVDMYTGKPTQAPLKQQWMQYGPEGLENSTPPANAYGPNAPGMPGNQPQAQPSGASPQILGEEPAAPKVGPGAPVSVYEHRAGTQLYSGPQGRLYRIPQAEPAEQPLSILPKPVQDVADELRGMIGVGPGSIPFEGLDKIAQGVYQLGDVANQVGWHAVEGTTATPGERLPQQAAGGAGKVIGGGLEIGSVLIPYHAITDPIRTVGTLAAWELASKGTEKGLEAAGVPQEYSELAGQIAGLGAGAAVAGPASAKIADLFKPGGRFGPGIDIGSLSDEQVMYGYMAARQSGDQAAQEMFGKEGLRRQAAYAADATADAHGHQGPGLEAPGAQPPPEAPAPQPPQPTPPPEPPPAATPPGGEPPAPEPTGQPPAPSAAPEPQSGPSPAPAPIAKGATYDTPQGTYKVEQLAGNRVMFTLNQNGKVTPGIRTTEDFKDLVGLPQGPVSTGIAGPAPTELNLNGGNVGPSPAGPTTFAGQTPNLPNLGGLKPIPEPQPEPVPGVAGFLQPSPAPAPPTAGPASIGQPVDYNQRPLTLPGGPQVSSTDLDQFIRNLPPAPASFAPPSPSAPAASPVSYTKPPVSYTKSATDRQPSLPGFSVQPDLSTGGSSQNEPAHEFSSTQVNLPSAVADKVRAAGAAIPDSQLAEDGREDQPHITVKYGLHGEDPAPVQQLLVNEPPITATLGKASVFKGEDGKPDVLKVDVESPDLHRLNAKIAALPHTDTFPTYQPHVTVAYLKPGEGKEYSGKDIPGVTGQQVTLNSVQFSGKSGQVLNIPLEGKPESQNSVSPEPPSGVSQPAPLDSRPAAVKLADAVYQQLRAGVPLGKQPDFYKKAELFFGSPRTSGQWDVKDAMDAMEAGVNKLLVERGADLMKMDPVEAIGELRKLQNLLPTQGTRTEEQLKAQQFSTPPAESFVAAKAAGITPSDVVLEPSAGNGGLAAWPKAIGAETHVNEISTRRAQMLEAAGFGKPTAHDGELINTLLDPSVKPTVVLMNPPFSSGALKSHQGKNRNQYGFNHVDQALQRLAPGGRLVAILGGGRANDPNGGASLTGGETGKWFDRLRKQYNIRANVRVNGKEYQKYGTNFATRIIVIDKSGPLKSWSDIVTGNVDTLEEAYNLLKNVAADRPTPQVSAGAGSPLRPGQGQPATGVGAGAQPGGNGGGALLPGGGGTPEAGGPGNRPNGPPGEPGPDRSGAGGESAGVQQPGPRTPEPSVPPGAAGPEGRPQPDDLRPVRSDGQPAGDGQPSAPSLTPQQQATPLTGDEGSPDLAPIEQEDQPLSERQEGQAYVTYRPAIKGAAHPGDIVETTTMATVKLPKATYRPNLPANVGISAVQMEAVQMAGQQNEILLPGGFRAAALIGDGTGVGKGREAAAYLWDNWRQGRKRLVWVSKNWDLVQDAMRDLTGIGAGDEMLRGIEKQPSGKFVITPKSSVQPLNRWNYTAKIDHQGLVYSTYGTVRAKDKKGNRRVAQLEAYLRGDDDGEGAAIVFDESHTLKNAVPARGTPASQIGQAVKDLLQRIPKLRTLSLSATAATDVVNLGYLDRLGLWGPGTPFPNGFQEFQSKIGTGGISAMEMIARELKAQGKYISRTLSFHGVDYDTAEHALTDDQKELYRTAAQAWSTVLGNASQTIDTVTNGGGEQRGNFLSQFYGTQQRFFNLLITTLKIPTAVDLANKALAEGKAVVITLVNTNEAAQNREKNKALGEGDDDEAIPDYDFGPKEMLVELVKNHYPTQQYQDDVNDDGDPIKVPMYTTDAEGREISVQNPTAVAARDALIEQINRDLHMPENPLDILIQSLGGPRKVAELTGRKERFDRTLGKFIPRGDPNVPQKDINLVEMRNFQGGKKDVAVLSAAADTGISLHAGNDVANQKRRFHITLQAGWSADKAMQMLGRTHRTNQVHPPQYVMLVSDLGGEKRFVSTISRRLGSLGALTKGQKNATGGNDLMDKVNFETDQGRQATNTFYERMLANQAIPGTDLTGMQILHDLHVLRPSGGGGMTVPPAERTNVTRLLNRLLALDPDTQNPVYNYFYDIFQASVQDAIERGTLDTGVKTMPGDEFHVKEQRVIATDPKTGAQTFYYPVDASVRTQAVSPAELTKRLVQHATENPTFFVNDKGEVALAIDAPPIVSASGRVTPALYTSRPGNGKWTKIPRGNFPRGTREVTQATEQDVTKATNDLASAERNLNLYRNYAERNPGATWWADGLKGAQERLQEAQTALATARAMAQDPIGWAKQRWAEQYQDAPKHTTQERHLIGGAVLRYWNPIRDVGGHTIYTAVDSGTGQRVVGVEIDPHEIGGLLQRISGGASTVNTAQLIADVLRNNLSYTLEGGIQVRPGRIGREPVIQLIPPNRDVAENLKRLGVLYEKGVQPVYYVPNAESQVPANKTRTAILDKILEQYPVRPETPGAEDRPQFMRAVPGFYSQLERAIEQKMPARSPVAQVQSILLNTQNAVKADELKWSGMETWLEDHKGQTVSKQDVLDFLKQNQVQLQEVEKGKVLDHERIRKADEALAQARAEVAAQQAANTPFREGDRVATVGSAPSRGGYSYSTGKIYQATRTADGMLRWRKVSEFGGERSGRSDKFIRELKEQAQYPWIDRVDHNGLVGAGPRVLFEGRAFGSHEKLYSAEAQAEAARRPSGTPTKFDKWKSPGGQNYRELLLTLPEKPPKEPLTALPTGYTVEEHPDHAVVRAPDGSEFERNAFAKYAVRDAIARLNASRSLERLVAAAYESPHWDEPNVIAHIRFTDRTGPNGEKILHVEEIQSDWHQKGREKGYRPAGAELAELKAQADAAQKDLSRAAGVYADGIEDLKWGKKDAQGERPYRSMRAPYAGYAASPEWQETMDRISQAERDQKAARLRIHEADRAIMRKGAPPAPFAKNWHEMAFRRALRYAAENGYDQVTWNTGGQQAARYDLSKHVDSIHYSPEEKRLWAVKNGSNVLDQAGVAPEQIPDYVGKDLARKLLDSPVDEGTHDRQSVSGSNLKIGGEGMQGFYDQILPQYANKYGKKWGAQVSDVKLKGIGGKVHSLPITPAMRESVMRGQPLFARTPEATSQYSQHGPIQFRAHGNAIVTTPAGLRALASVWGETATMSGVALNRRHALMAAEALQGTAKPLAMAIAKAANLPGSGSVVIADGENSLKDTATILRHERWHLTQDRLRGFLDNHLGRHEQEFLNLPLARMAAIPLKMMGYATHELAAELGAHLAAGQYERLGLSRPQWKQLFHTYLQLLKAEHGDKLKEALTSVHPALQEAIRAAITEGTDTPTTGRPGESDRGGVRQETGRAASRGTPQFARAGPGQGAVREFLSSETGTSTVIPAIAEAAQGLAKAKDDILKLLAPAAREGAQPGAMVIRHRAAEMAQRTARAEKALESARDAFRKMPEADRWAWFDRVENGTPDPDPTLESIAKLVRGLLDGRRADVQALGTGKLQKWIENYMPHAYKDPQKAGQVIGEYYSKRPMEGSKSFLKARKFETIADGMAAGLVPISDNPMDLVLLKLREMDKYIMAHRVLNDLKAQGLSKYVSVFDERPPGWQQIDDRVGTVYGPPTVTVKEAYDKALMERLDSLASSLGIQHIRKVAIGGQRLGYTSQGGPIVTKFAGPESILIHEIGHQLEFKFGLWDRLKNLKYPDREKELRALADLRYEGDPNVSKSFKSYVREKDEKIANAVAALVYAPERFQEVAPNTWDALRDELWHIPAARPLFEARRSMTLGTRTAEVPVGGMVTMGHWAMPEPVARLVNNYLSPGLAQSQLYRLYQQAGNTLNNFQLGFSAFHLGFTSIDAATSGLALGIYQAAHGHPVQGLVNALKSPVEVLGVPLGLAAKGAEKLGVKGATSAAAPVSSFLRGDRMLQEYYKPGSQGAQIADMVSALIIGGGRARMDRMYQTNTTQKMMDAFHRGGFGILAGALRIPFALAEQSVRPILDYIVPRQKLGVFADLAEFELQRMAAGEIQTEQLPALLARAWDSVDNRLGQLVYDNLFWNKIVKDLLMVSVRSVGWNTGTIREILGSAADARKMASGDPEMSTRLSYVLALPIMVALIGSLVHYLYNGKGPESLADTFQPRTGRPDKSGQPERVNPPSYIKDVIGVEEKGLWKTAKDKIHPLLTLIADELANEDFRHKPIVEPDDPFLLSVQKRLLFALSSYESMAQRNIQKERERNATGASEYIAPFFGVTPAPAPANRMLRPAPAPTPFRPARQVHPHKPRKAA